MKGRPARAIVFGAIALASCSAPAAGSKGPAPQPVAPVGPITAPLQPAPSPVPESCQRQTLIGTVAVARVAARTAPSRSARKLHSFARTNAQGAPQVFDLLDEATAAGGDPWYRALLPVRPNGTIGFLPARSLGVSQTLYRLVVDRKQLRLTLWNGCRVAGRYPIGLGTMDTPTPVGTFYLVALVKPPTDGSVYGAYAYGLSAYSDALTNWTGGGIIGLHGTNDPSSIGKRQSHGCIRMRNPDIEHLAKILPLGTPIEIH